VAENPSNYEFSAVETQEILAERQEGWDRFTQLATWSILLIVVALVLLALFVA
jgi:uncharacterized membrane protein affecting hemolysin expression